MECRKQHSCDVFSLKDMWINDELWGDKTTDFPQHNQARGENQTYNKPNKKTRVCYAAYKLFVLWCIWHFDTCQTFLTYVYTKHELYIKSSPNTSEYELDLLLLEVVWRARIQICLLLRIHLGV